MPSAFRIAACLFMLLSAADGHAVELNAANQAELEQVKGLGPQLSGRLLEERRKAPFRDWADMIRRMKGVGPASALKLSAGGLSVAGAAYAPPPGEAAQAASAAVAASPVRR